MNCTKELIEKTNQTENEYRSLPFWSLNDKLDKNMLKQQIQQMKDAGIGGFFMHARGGLETPYMKEGWMSCVKTCISKAEELGMQAWCYDEEGWPSGFAGGAVTALGYNHFQKWITIEEKNGLDIDYNNYLGVYCIDGRQITDTSELCSEDTYITICINYNRYYIDILNDATIKEFLQATHEQYYKHICESFGKAMKGFFTDEPQYATQRFPWSLCLEEKFKKEYGYELLPLLPCLKYQFEGYQKVRFDYWNLISKLYTESFGKQVYEWCRKHNCMLTGHVLAEDTLYSQMCGTAGAMAFYQYMDMPGIDWLGRSISSPVVPKQVSSAAAQLGHKKVLAETFALCGWDVKPRELKRIAEWQYINGVNVMCQHLQSYTLRGLRKRDYPASLFTQLPWWEEYKYFNDYFARLGSILGENSRDEHLLLMHPIKSAYIAYNGENCDELKSLDSAFEEITSKLSDLHILHDYGDEQIMSTYGHVEGYKMIIGECQYSTILLPPMLTLTESTFDLLYEFASNEGQVYSFGDLPTMVNGVKCNKLIDLMQNVKILDKNDSEIINNLGTKYIRIKYNAQECYQVHYTSRHIDDKRHIYFLANLSEEDLYNVTVEFNSNCTITHLNLEDMSSNILNSTQSFNKTIATLDFKMYQSYLLIVETENEGVNTIDKKTVEKTPLKGDFEIVSKSVNSLTLDICDFSINDGPWEKDMPVILLQKNLLRQKHVMKYSCKVKLRFNFIFETDPKDISNIFLAMEKPVEFKISVNGHRVTYSEIGFWLDSEFKKVDISDYLIKGKNEIILERYFYQSQTVYDVLNTKDMHESEINKLTYDVELESIYLCGDFGVYATSGWKYIERNAMITDRSFVIRKAPTSLSPGEITSKGFCFFSGVMELSRDINIELKPDVNYLLTADKFDIQVLHIYVNGKSVRTLAWPDYDTDITDYLVNGSNTLKIKIYSGNRNLLGPHHFKYGESYSVGPATFTDEAGWTESKPENIWSDKYCFVKFGI